MENKVHTVLGNEDEIEGTCQSTLPSRDASNGVRAFHNGTEESLLLYVYQNATKGDPTSVVNAVDTFCYTQHWMMHMGEQKADVVKQELLKTKATFKNTHPTEKFSIVELGSYCGYSAVVLASLLNPEEGDHLYCIETNADCVQWTKRMLQYANLLDRVTLIHTPASDVQAWKEQLRSPPVIDFLFVDHDKAAYHPDLLVIEQAQLLRTGSVVVADNVLSLNQPKIDYLNHVRESQGLYSSSVLHEGFLEYTTAEERQGQEASMTKDGIEVSIFK